jgi:hypothetical protein
MFGCKPFPKAHLNPWDTLYRTNPLLNLIPPIRFWIEQCFAHNKFYPYPIFDLVGTPGRIGLFTLSAAIMTGSTMLLKRLYSLVNNQSQHRNSTALDEGTIQEQVEAYVKEGKYIIDAQFGSRQSEQQASAGVGMDESSMAEAAEAYIKEGKYIATGQM